MVFSTPQVNPKLLAGPLLSDSSLPPPASSPQRPEALLTQHTAFRSDITTRPSFWKYWCPLLFPSLYPNNTTATRVKRKQSKSAGNLPRKTARAEPSGFAVFLAWQWASTPSPETLRTKVLHLRYGIRGFAGRFLGDFNLKATNSSSARWRVSKAGSL